MLHILNFGFLREFVLSFFFFSDITKACYEDLSNEQRQTVHEILQQQVQAYFQFHNISTKDEVSGLYAHIQNAHSLALESVGVGSPNSVPL